MCVMCDAGYITATYTDVATGSFSLRLFEQPKRGDERRV